jgi:hypothetical protein
MPALSSRHRGPSPAAIRAGRPEMLEIQEPVAPAFRARRGFAPGYRSNMAAATSMSLDSRGWIGLAGSAVAPSLERRVRALAWEIA